MEKEFRDIALFPDGGGFLLSGVNGRVAVEYFDDSPAFGGKKRSYKFKCHRDNPKIYSVNQVGHNRLPSSCPLTPLTPFTLVGERVDCFLRRRLKQSLSYLFHLLQYCCCYFLGVFSPGEGEGRHLRYRWLRREHCLLGQGTAF